MIDNSILSKEFEEKLYKFYDQLDELEKVNSRIDLLESQVKEIEDDIRNTNVTINIEENMGIDYSKDKIQSSGYGSPQENGLINQIDNLIKELLEKRKELNTLRATRRKLKAETKDMKYDIYESPQKLSDEARILLEDMYMKKKSLRQIADETYLSKSNVDYNKKRIIQSIAAWEQIKKTTKNR